MKAVKLYKRLRSRNSGRVLIALVQLAASYGFTSVAINNGNLIIYLIALVLFTCGVKNLIILIGSLFNGKRTQQTN